MSSKCLAKRLFVLYKIPLQKRWIDKSEPLKRMEGQMVFYLMKVT